jgi:hypothetical protein
MASYPVTIDPDVTEEIAAAGDDGSENQGAATWFNNANIFGNYYGLIRNAGFRFTTVAVAQAAVIANATFKLRVTGNYQGYATGKLYGADEDSSAQWSDSIRPSNRTKTAASTVIPSAGSSGIKSYDVTAVVQEIVDRAGWASGNNISLFVLNTSAGTDNTYWEAFESAGTDEAVLEITLDGGGGGTKAPPPRRRMTRYFKQRG